MIRSRKGALEDWRVGELEGWRVGFRGLVRLGGLFCRFVTRHPGELIQFLAQMPGGKLHFLFVASFQCQQRHTRDRRIAELFAKLDVLFVKAGKVVTPLVW